MDTHINENGNMNYRDQINNITRSDKGIFYSTSGKNINKRAKGRYSSGYMQRDNMSHTIDAVS